MLKDYIFYNYYLYEDEYIISLWLARKLWVPRKCLTFFVADNKEDNNMYVLFHKHNKWEAMENEIEKVKQDYPNFKTTELSEAEIGLFKKLFWKGGVGSVVLEILNNDKDRLKKVII